MRPSLISLPLAAGALLVPHMSRGSADASALSPTRLSLRADTPIAEIPFVLHGDYVLLQASVNGKLGSFVLDTGSSVSTLDAEWADTAAHVRVVATGQQVQGAASVRSSTGETDSLRIGTVEMGRTQMALIPLGPVSRARGMRLDGTIGFDFLSRYVVEIDYRAQRLRLYRPAGWTYRGAGMAVPISLQMRIPVVEATIAPAGRAPLTARLALDLGSGNLAVRLVAPFVETHGLAQLPGIDAPIGTGVGGTIVGRLARLDSMSLGTLRVAAPTVGLALRREGFFGATWVDGTLGSSIFRRTTLILDYPRSRVIFEPGPGFDAPFEVDMSGMSLAGAPGEPVAVTYVVAGSPAAQAGIAPGDVLVSVDGTAATPETIDAIRAALRSGPGATRRLVLRRGTQTREATITLRRLI
ncbi:MAG TPA: PDZ domain-containing protein [Longimicrobium sp.]|nr:PDZ domain-containing protein [Longimicrobium sp.]